MCSYQNLSDYFYRFEIADTEICKDSQGSHNSQNK